MFFCVVSEEKNVIILDADNLRWNMWMDVPSPPSYGLLFNYQKWVSLETM